MMGGGRDTTQKHALNLLVTAASTRHLTSQLLFIFTMMTSKALLKDDSLLDHSVFGAFLSVRCNNQKADAEYCQLISCMAESCNS